MFVEVRDAATGEKVTASWVHPARGLARVYAMGSIMDTIQRGRFSVTWKAGPYSEREAFNAWCADQIAAGAEPFQGGVRSPEST